MSTTDTRRGANWTPPANGAQCFEAPIDEGSPEETCLHCGKHISRHFGGTEYRCAANADERAGGANLLKEFLTLLAAEMKCQSISRSELARRMSVSPAFISKALSGEGNPTLRTLIDLSGAAGLRPRIVAIDCGRDTGRCGACLECHARLFRAVQEHREELHADNEALRAQAESAEQRLALIAAESDRLAASPLVQRMIRPEETPEQALTRLAEAERDRDTARAALAAAEVAIQAGEVEREGLRRDLAEARAMLAKREGAYDFWIIEREGALYMQGYHDTLCEALREFGFQADDVVRLVKVGERRPGGA